ncbi:TPA: RelA/SpoT domain-containing protein [Legionella pneumophila]|nr:RelA/SpoT domain-containing protein [Legionella pneumophila]
MNLDEYKQKIQLYEKFSHTVKDILTAAISSSTQSDVYRYHLQQIQCRVKTYDSLSKRLKEVDKLNSDRIEELRHDLSGCRIIFYFNDDVNAFLNSGIIRDNFKIDWDKSKIHGPGDSPKVANDYYTANHYVVELSDDRLKLPEYSEFHDLKCEIQVQTVLNHAWSETAHDITYKKPDDSDFGKYVLDAIDDRLAKIMEQYLKPAGYEFQKIQRDYRRFLEGKKLLGRNLPKEIIDCKDNNERYEILERYREYTLPHFSDYQNELPSILDLAKIAIAESNKINPVEIETPLGSIPGKTSKDILTICLSMISYVRYVDPAYIFTSLVELYTTLTEQQAKNSVIEGISNLIKYDIDVLNQYGFSVQYIVLDTLEDFSSDLLASVKPLIANIGSSILDPTIEGISSNYKSFSIRKGSIPAGEQASSLRDRMLKLMFKQYNSNDSESTKRLFISAFNTATRTPTMGNYPDELLEIILSNCVDIIEFYTDKITTEQYEILESIESDVCFLYRRSSDILDGNKITNEKCKVICKTIMAKSKVFREQLNSIDDYVIYKTLVGFESVFIQSWSDDGWDVTGKNEFREEQIQLYVDQINYENQAQWKNIILRCTQTKSNDRATFPLFCKFLNLLSVTHPIFSFELIKDYQQELMPFSAAIFDGLLKSKLHDDLIAQMKSWVKDGNCLGECAKAFEFYSPLDEELLSEILKIARKHDDIYALTKLIVASTKNYDEHNKHLIGSLFLPAIEALTKLNDASWIGDFWFRPEKKNLIADLNSDEVETILSNLVLMEKIDFHTEEILIPIAEKYPQKILHFFKQRIDIDSTLNKRARYYEAIPFNFHQLAHSLADHLDTVLATIGTWYNGDYHLFCFRGAKLISNIFPKYIPALNTKLLELVSSGEEKNYYIVMAILRNYQGAPELNDICRKIICSLPKDSDLLTEISNIMQSTGVLKGEFGRVNALKQKKEAISNWSDDSNPKVKEFAHRYIADLDKQIIYEQRRAEEDIELRKHQYGDDDDATE